MTTSRISVRSPSKRRSPFKKSRSLRRKALRSPVKKSSRSKSPKRSRRSTKKSGRKSPRKSTTRSKTKRRSSKKRSSHIDNEALPQTHQHQTNAKVGFAGRLSQYLQKLRGKRSAAKTEDLNHLKGGRRRRH